MVSRGGFFSYIKKAFIVPWNLLAFGAVSVAGIISGYPEVVLPAAAALEILYLSGLASHPRFQAAIDAAQHKEHSAVTAEATQKKMAEMVLALARPDREQFEKLRRQARELRDIAARVRSAETGSAISDVHSSGVNRLLWILLKLLYSKGAIEKFFKTIDLSQIKADIAKVELRLAELRSDSGDGTTLARRRTSLEDQRKTLELRLENYSRAKGNYELVQDEIDRLSTKIATLAEMGVSRQDPNFISSEVDSVTASVESSEKAMQELEFLTGLSSTDDVPPQLMEPGISAAE
ncbi:MAG: hypothetical protein MUC50_01435 [Myxococcota bacterium]|jgi:hypothetical protein|nr:hypothetical protein [Myxococcota bacterium]